MHGDYAAKISAESSFSYLSDEIGYHLGTKTFKWIVPEPSIMSVAGGAGRSRQLSTFPKTVSYPFFSSELTVLACGADTKLTLL